MTAQRYFAGQQITDPPVGAKFERVDRHTRRVLELVEVLPEGTHGDGERHACDRFKLRMVVDEGRAPHERSSLGFEFWVEDMWFRTRVDFKRIA